MGLISYQAKILLSGPDKFLVNMYYLNWGLSRDFDPNPCRDF